MFFVKQILFMLFSHWGKAFATSHVKKKGLLLYLKMLQAVRRSLLAVIAFFCLLQLMVIGAIGTFVTAVFLGTGDTTTKLWILLAGFLLILVIPLVGIGLLFSERLWFKFSGAEEQFASEMARNRPTPPPPAPRPAATRARTDSAVASDF